MRELKFRFIILSILTLLFIALFVYAGYQAFADPQPLIMREPLSGQSTTMIIHAVSVDVDGQCILNCIVLPDSSKLEIHLTNEHLTILGYASGMKNLLGGQ